MATSDYVLLHTGQKMPLIGLGTWKSAPGEVKAAVWNAVKTGYRHIDCAAVYNNEAEIGEFFKENVGTDKMIRREELFVTSKLWNTKHHPEDVEVSCCKSLDDLKLTYLDLYLIHWPHAFERGDIPFPKNPDGTIRYDFIDYKETWKAMETLVKKGLVKAIGLSNFNSQQIDDIISIATIKPAVLQIECHPYLAQNELIGHCQKHGLVVTAYSPLGSSDRLWKAPDEPVLLADTNIKAIAEKHGKSPAQVMLRWQVQRGVVAIPKSVNPARIAQNLQVFDFTLTEDEMKRIGTLNRNWRYIVPKIKIDNEFVHRDAQHPYYPFNDPY
ncbi:aldo-keto reductase family 1 member A1-B isoform X1 [Hemiscyllium ocellatum]|uniref:aldo-keto reductase family 1 member A1-B isoform X1 n=2 Tax=Hemiscyllium ocellatum TaxID=170820 RepID=UPI0029660C2C|nr:aldo-keto reductase family 1 member A1-B isoform X1 [Hemiscyllium ocellatum]XP_060686470.1 aldo-keto reductase family 1 member A1-B isoform X1 [Hemiscyllium ocellatum]